MSTMNQNTAGPATNESTNLIITDDGSITASDTTTTDGSFI
jgi:hypothetical protein